MNVLAKASAIRTSVLAVAGAGSAGAHRRPRGRRAGQSLPPGRRQVAGRRSAELPISSDCAASL